ncbi:hypothetical protein [Candidatus Pelagibacter sp. HIMB1695]|uniref:hypothetical protein n=1 Tax=Candidatus Pelagibacter sp. HIMB1695 TaxID=3413364 RepID=UPI003F851867
MLNYHFNSKLLTTKVLLKELSISISTLDFWKTQWRKKGNDCWDMGLRLIGKKAYWDPIMFLDWIVENKLKNLPKDKRDKNLILFVSRNSSEKEKK